MTRLLAGNALAVHDVEYATLGTSLGMKSKRWNISCKRSQKSYGCNKFSIQSRIIKKNGATKKIELEE